MKKRAVSLSVLAALIAALILVPVLPFSSAAIADGDWASLDFTVLMQQVNSINMADNEVLEYGKYCMRGFAVSPDGKYLFGGFLNPSNESAIVRFDTETGHAGGYWYYEQTEGEKIGTKSYPKGLDCDDRGYLYAGLAYNPNKIDVNFAVIKYDENGKDDLLKTVSVTNIFHDPANTKIGVNGVRVKIVGSNYYFYAILNYDEDYLYRFNVTTPEAPVLDNSFGNGGRIVLSDDAYKVETGKIKDANYIDVDDDGTIYMAYTSESGAGLMKLSEDGKSVIGNVEQRKGYGVCIVDDTVLCSSQNSPCEINVYDKNTLRQVATFNITTDNTVIPLDESLELMFKDPVNSLVTMRYTGGVLYIADQGANGSDLDQVFATGLTDEGKAEVKRAADVLTALGASLQTTEEKTTAKAEVPDKTEPVTTAGGEQPTEPEDAGTTAEPSADVTTDAPGTEPAKQEGGCSSAAALIPAAAMLALGFAVSKRRR